MKYILLFLIVAVLVFGYQSFLNRKNKRLFWRSARAWIIPAVYGAAAVVSLLFFNLNFSGRII